ncbi:MAG: tail fiber domain-containing protein [Chloracidobacterium sp.]|nr:tail fiber domain-containing protein [Chloracidobacterium sp.]
MTKLIATTILFAGLLLMNQAVFAQSTEFTYQGSLKDGAGAATGNYDFEFALFDSLAAGSQIGSTLTRNTVAVAGGTFAVKLDFGSQFPGATRFLEIRVRLTGGGALTTLSPRQQVNSSPYAVKSLSADTAATAANANTAASATNALSLGGVAAGQYVLTGDARLSDARSPLSGSGNYVQNTTGQQPATNFNISGNGTAGGTLSGQNVNSTFEYRLGGQRFASQVSSNLVFGLEAGTPNGGLANTYAGYRAGLGGTSNTSNNAFFGANAGRSNFLGNDNSFFGNGSGELNSSGGFNAFFGSNSGAANSNGNRNAFFGVTAGRDNTLGSDNTFVGGAAGQANQSGNNNSFFGSVAGTGTTTGSNNSFFGRASGNVNVSGTFNTAIGDGANVGSANLNFATAIGAGAIASASNTIALGRNAGQDTVVVPGTLSVTGSINGTVSHATNADNAINATNAINASNATNAANAAQLGGVAANQFVQTNDGRLTDARSPLPGSSNYIQNGTSAQGTSNFNISGTGTANVLNAATQFNIGGSRVLSVAGTHNLFAGFGAGAATTAGIWNSFFGESAGSSNTNGYDNSFFGGNAGSLNTSGNFNSFFGEGSGATNTGGNKNTLIGANSDVGVSFLTNATAIGANARVDQSNSLVLGSVNGFNGATFDTNVGIGTTYPRYRLHVVGENVRVEGNTTAIFPRYSLNFTGGAVDAKKWQNYATTNSLTFTALNDAETSETGWLTVNRAGPAITSISSPNGNVNIGTANTPDKLGVNGTMSLGALGSAGSTALCRNVQNQISTCSSSLRYKTNISRFDFGLNLVNQLKPITFDWKDGGMHDLGLGAEDVAAIEPLLVTYNKDGQVEGVKYDRIGVVLVNAVKEQQEQIEAQDAKIKSLEMQLEAFKALVCSQNPSAEVCRARN